MVKVSKFKVCDEVKKVIHSRETNPKSSLNPEIVFNPLGSEQSPTFANAIDRAIDGPPEGSRQYRLSV